MATPTTSAVDQLHDRRPSVEPDQHVPTTSDDQPRQDVALCASYAEAALLTERLADRGFPVEHLAIVADAGPEGDWGPPRRALGRAALRGLDIGSVVGGVAGLLFGLVHRVDPLSTALVMLVYGVLLGAAVGATVGVVARLVGGRAPHGTEATGLDLEPPTGHRRHRIVADGPSSWVRAVTILHGGARVGAASTAATGGHLAGLGLDRRAAG